ncbi:hypothetical protein TNCT_527561 [Trichonephila clavata]|uniref:Uncharacterized protein n=1 Tax=Trichonephila clavata TaxID=2740835 RepID=A0A8X6F6C2_TRICU|nr:hypothetical protein TNCT_527561 [Trichonephila clavata]
MLNDASIKQLFNIKGVRHGFCEATDIKHPNPTKCTRELLLPLPSSYLTEWGFNVILLKRRNGLDISKREDLRLKLTKLKLDVKSPCN